MFCLLFMCGCYCYMLYVYVYGLPIAYCSSPLSIVIGSSSSSCIIISSTLITIINCIIIITTTVSFHNFKSQEFKLSISNPKNKCVAYLFVLSQI